MKMENEPWMYELTINYGGVLGNTTIEITRAEKKKISEAKDDDKYIDTQGLKFRKSNIVSCVLLAYEDCPHCHAMVFSKIYDQHKYLCGDKCYEKHHTYWRPETVKDYYRRLNPENRIYINDLTHFCV
jgi:hypothetical protein